MISDGTVIVCSDRFVDDKDILSVLKVIPRSLPDLSVHVDFSFFWYESKFEVHNFFE